MMDNISFGTTRFRNIPKALFPNLQFPDTTKSTTEIKIDTANATQLLVQASLPECITFTWYVLLECNTPLSCQSNCDALTPNGCIGNPKQCFANEISFTACTGFEFGGGSGTGGVVIPLTGGGGDPGNGNPPPHFVVMVLLGIEQNVVD
jgi:hypothetical protein